MSLSARRTLEGLVSLISYFFVKSANLEEVVAALFSFDLILFLGVRTVGEDGGSTSSVACRFRFGVFEGLEGVEEGVAICLRSRSDSFEESLLSPPRPCGPLIMIPGYIGWL